MALVVRSKYRPITSNMLHGIFSSVLNIPTEQSPLELIDSWWETSLTIFEQDYHSNIYGDVRQGKYSDSKEADHFVFLAHLNHGCYVGLHNFYPYQALQRCCKH